MAALTWDNVGERFYETGVDRGVLYVPDAQGVYTNGHAWSGLVSVTESPSGAEPNAQYADNLKYLNLYSAEEFGATIEAFTYPDEFRQFDGMNVPVAGVTIGQQSRGLFGLSYRTRIGNDVKGDDLGFKIHLIYGCQASPSEKAYTTVNDSPEALTFSWEIATTPVEVANLRPTSIITIDSTKVDPEKLTAFLKLIWGTEGNNPTLPLPAAVISAFDEGLDEVTPLQPGFDDFDEITIPTVTGVEYFILGVLQEPGTVTITEDVIVEARPATGYRFPDVIDTDWYYKYVNNG